MGEHGAGENVVKKSVALRRDQVESIHTIAVTDKHKNFSRVVQDAVDQLIERRDQSVEPKDEEAA